MNQMHMIEFKKVIRWISWTQILDCALVERAQAET